MRNDRKEECEKLAWVAVALVIMVLSMTVVSKAASNPENHKNDRGTG